MPAAREWRIHFHVPLFTARATTAWVDAGLRARGPRDRRRARVHARISRSRPTRGTCCPPGLKIDLLESIAPRVRVGAGEFSQPKRAEVAARRTQPGHCHAQDRRPQRRRPDADSCSAPSMPALTGWAQRGRRSRAVKPAFPAVTCTAQSDYLTGQYPDTHGIVGNGWYFARGLRRSGSGSSRTSWCRRRRSGRRRAPPTRRSPARTCSGGSTCTRRPTSRSRRGRCTPPTAARSPTSTPRPARCATSCRPSSARFRCSSSGGRAPSIRLDAWIAERARSRSIEKHDPTLTLVYLPHLDYNLQRLGPGHPAHAERTCAQVDDVVRRPDRSHYEARGARVIVLSEYGIVDVSTARPPQSRAARARPDRGARGARPRDARPGRERRVRRRRSPGRARLRRTIAARSARCGSCSERRRASSAVLDDNGQARPPGCDHAARRRSDRRRRAGRVVHVLLLARRRAARPTSRARSTSTASPATTRWSCSSIRRSGSRR